MVEPFGDSGYELLGLFSSVGSGALLMLDEGTGSGPSGCGSVSPPHIVP